jgi:hypothetical protein
MLNDLEFVLLAAYLVLILVFILCVKKSHGREPFFDANSTQSLGSHFNVLFEMPGKVKNMVVPELEKVSKSLSGETAEGEEEELNFVHLGKNNMHLTQEELDEIEGNEYTDTPKPKFDAIRKTYAQVDYLLCRLKHADKELYDNVMGMAWVTPSDSDSVVQS